MQEAALQAWRRRGQLRDAKSADAWFSRIVVNACRDELRRRARRPAPNVVAMVLDDPNEAVGQRDEVERVIARMTPDEQLVVGLRFGRDMSAADIARATGLPLGTVKSRLHHALDHLRAAFAAERLPEDPPR